MTTDSLENMITELFRGIQQPPEEMACLAVLDGEKSVHCIGSKCLVEKAPVQSPTITVRQKRGIETQSTPVVMDGD